MKRTTILALLGALGMLTSASTFAQSANDTQPPPHDGSAGPHRPDPEARRKMLLAKYDANKDGQFDESEYAAIGKDVVDGKLGPGPGGRPGGPDGQGFRGPRGGGPQGGPRHEELLKKYDANGDGKLDESERAAIRKDIEDGKLQPPPRRGFGPPPGGESPDGPQGEPQQ
jgi:hypothetical protein